MAPKRSTVSSKGGRAPSPSRASPERLSTPTPPSPREEDYSEEEISLLPMGHLIAVHGTVNPIHPNSLFGTARGMDGDQLFQFQGNASLFSEPSTSARDELLTEGNELTLRSIISTAPFEALGRNLLRNPNFFFGDAAVDLEKKRYAGHEEWYYTMGGEKYYLPTCRRHYPLKYFVCTTKERKMKWNLTPSIPGAQVEKFTGIGPVRAGPEQNICGLQPGISRHEIPTGEVPSRVKTFINLFARVNGNYSAKEFRAPGWNHSTPKQWWSRLTNYILKEFSCELETYKLFEAVRATGYGFKLSSITF